VTPAPGDLSTLVARSLAEDVGPGDVTTRAVVDPARQGVGTVLAKDDLRLCGLPAVVEVFRQVDPSLTVEALVPEGSDVLPITPVARVAGSMASILTGERLALNLLQRMSGVATQTRRYVAALDGADVRLVDTRKTTPGLRSVEKYAVRVGGGHNHRFALYDGVMIKDNHIEAAGGVAEAVAAAKASTHHLLAILVEVGSLAQAHAAVDAGARVLMLDNFELDALSAAVAELRARPEELVLEASGRVRLDTLAAIAATGVDVISSGALIHQARWVDLSLEIEAR
jgi:nicotinate-nucleotide pyrophosphorylase (carboxylating)